MGKTAQWFILASCLAATVLALTSSLWLLPYLHDRTLANFSSEIAQLPLPSGTTRQDVVTVVGQQSGNGDHCDYLVAVTLITDMGKHEAEEYFKGKYSDPTNLRFLWADEMEQYASQANAAFSIHVLSEWVRGRQHDDKTNLVVYRFEGSMTSSWDYRCR